MIFSHPGRGADRSRRMSAAPRMRGVATEATAADAEAFAADPDVADFGMVREVKVPRIVGIPRIAEDGIGFDLRPRRQRPQPAVQQPSLIIEDLGAPWITKVRTQVG